MSAREYHAGHEAVGAYALGVLDSADAAGFEAHLAGCDECGRQLEELSVLEPLLAELADPPPGPADRPVPPPWLEAGTVTARPGPGLLDRMVDEVAVARRRRGRRSLYLVAAAAALIVTGPVATAALSSDGGTVTAARPSPGRTTGWGGPAADSFRQMPQKVGATDPVSKVSATVGMDPRGWGTDAVLELRNVHGPLTCSLVAVSRSGEEQTMTTWSVPRQGYGLAGSDVERARQPLYAHGGTGLQLKDIARFEVRTQHGERLVSITT